MNNETFKALTELTAKLMESHHVPRLRHDHLANFTNQLLNRLVANVEANVTIEQADKPEQAGTKS